MAAMFFLKKWSMLEDVNEVCKTDLPARAYVSSVITYLSLREKGQPCSMNLFFKTEQDLQDENNSAGNACC